jgi:predicted O-methyltransferase YrrM
MKERIDIFFDTFSEQPKPYIDELEKEALAGNEPIICRPTRNLLRYLLRTKRPETILEIGTAVG